MTVELQMNDVGRDESAIEEAWEELNERWQEPLDVISGRKFFNLLSVWTLENFGVSISSLQVVPCFRAQDVPYEVEYVISKIMDEKRLYEQSYRFLPVFFFQFALPDGHNSPSSFIERRFVTCIAILVRGYFLQPETCICLGNDIIPASFMPMPETAVYENDCTILWQNNVWLPWKSFDMKAIPEAIMP